jgi:hypothetical protein
MKTLVDRCATDRCADTHGNDDESFVADFKFAVSPPMRCVYPASSRRTGAAATGRVPYPVWLRWEVSHHIIDAPGLLAMVQANLAPYAQQCEVAYAQSRLVRGNVVRGRAKLVVVLADSQPDGAEAQRLLIDVADRAQERTLEQLLAIRNVETGRARLRLSPRERWLVYARMSS